MSCWSEWMDQSESLASERRPLVSAHLCGSWAHEVYGMPSGHVGVSLCWECQQQSSSSGYLLYFSAFKDENKWTLRWVRSTFVPRYIYKYISTATEKKKMQSILCVLIDSRPVKSSQLKGSFYSDPRSLFRCRHSWFVNDFLLLCFFLRLSETRNTHIVTLDYFGGSWWRSWHTHTHTTHTILTWGLGAFFLSKTSNLAFTHTSHRDRSAVRRRSLNMFLLGSSDGQISSSLTFKTSVCPSGQRHVPESPLVFVFFLFIYIFIFVISIFFSRSFFFRKKISKLKEKKKCHLIQWLSRCVEVLCRDLLKEYNIGVLMQKKTTQDNFGGL